MNVMTRRERTPRGSLSWPSFNMTATIARGSSTLAFDYGRAAKRIDEHGRVTQVAPEGTTIYLKDPASGLKVERVAGSGGAVTWNNYIYAGGALAK